jgi:nucleoid DNA-binding protein
MNQNKTSLWRLVTKRINHGVHRLHVISIISILIEEIIKDLKQGKDVKITNFGTFKLKELKPKKVRSIATKQIKFVGRTKSLRFRLTRRLSKYLSNKSLDDMRNSVEICEEKQEQ